MKPILFYDTETSGFPNWSLPADHPEQPRLVELGALLCHAETGDVMLELDAIIRPDGWTIGADVGKIHGITQEIALEEGRAIAEVLDEFQELVDQAGVLASYNLRFDEKIIRGERRRLGRPDGFGERPVFCCLKASRKIAKMPKGRPPKLADAAGILLGRTLDPDMQHRAIEDARIARDLYFACRTNPEFMAAGANFKTNHEREAH